MGTTCHYLKPHSIKDHLRSQFTHEHEHAKFECLDVKIVHLTEGYVAVRQTDKRTGEQSVWACVVKMSFSRGDMPYCEKEMEELMLPYFYNCPESILDLLTPTDNEYANQWRAKCRETIAARKAQPRKPRRKRPFRCYGFRC